MWASAGFVFRSTQLKKNKFLSCTFHLETFQLIMKRDSVSLNFMFLVASFLFFYNTLTTAQMKLMFYDACHLSNSEWDHPRRNKLRLDNAAHVDCLSKIFWYRCLLIFFLFFFMSPKRSKDRQKFFSFFCSRRFISNFNKLKFDMSRKKFSIDCWYLRRVFFVQLNTSIFLFA